MTQLSPRAVAPSGTDGDVLTTVNGKAMWNAPVSGGGSGGVPAGGSAGQVLTKLSATDYDTGWQTPSSGGGGSGTPTGTGGEDTYSSSLTQAGGSYNPIFNFVEIQEDLWLSAVKVYSQDGGDSLLTVRMSGGDLLTSGPFTSPSGAAGWATATLDQPLFLKAGSYIAFEMDFATPVRPWRDTSYLYQGTLWSMLADRLNNFFTGSSYSETPGMGLIEYNG